MKRSSAQQIAEDYSPTDDDQRIACLMLSSGGLTPKDIAAALKVREEQVCAWLGRREYRAG